jgi:hypothetical protein
MGFGDNSAAKRAFYRARGREIDRNPCADMRRRKRLEKDAEKWLRYYFPEAYFLRFTEPHKEIIRGALNALKTGGKFGVAAPRGIGKSTLLWGVSLFAVLTGLVVFPGYLPWSAKDRRGGLRFWKNALCFNERLAADYPEYCDPFVESKGSSQKCLALVWADNEKPCGAKLQVFEGTIVFPDGLGVIGGSTLKGNPRGLNHSAEDGRVLRPDMLLIDDPQDRKTAKSETMTEDAIKKIDADVAFMGAAGKKLPMLMACTITQTSDVADHYINHAGWDSLRIGLIKTWPKGWEDTKSKCFACWSEFGAIVSSEAHKQDGGKEARKYYRTNKAAMTKGMVVIDPQRFDKARKQPDALYAAIESYYENGAEAFMAEYQNEPLKQGVSVYELTPELICSRTSERKPYEVPEWAKVLVVGTDINDYGLHSVCTAFGNDHSAAVVWYKRWDRRGKPICQKNMNEAEKHLRFYEALTEHGKEVSELPLHQGGQKVHAGLWVIDRPYPAAVVHRYANEAGRTVGVPIAPAWGADFTRYRPFGKNVVGKPREECHMTEWPLGRGLVWNVDYWREVAQRSWIGSVGAPGACSLFEGRHAEFSEHICRWKLIEKMEGKTGMFWKWAQAPGWHDYGAAFYMCYAGAAWLGIGTGGVVQRAPRRKPRGGVKHVEV